MEKWDDYDGDIPKLEDSTDSPLHRGVLVLSQFYDEQTPVPDLEQLSPGEPIVTVPRRAIPPGSFDFAAGPSRVLHDRMALRKPTGGK